MPRTDSTELESSKPARRTRAPYSNGEKRRRALIEATFAVIAANGFSSLSLRELASHLGVSHSLLRHHFGSKEALLKDVLTYREEIAASWRDEQILSKSIFHAAPEILRRNTTERGLIALDSTLRIEALDPSHPAHDYMRGLDQRFYASVHASLVEEQQAGHLRADCDPALAAAEFTALVHGLQLAWLWDPQVDIVGRVEDFLARLRADKNTDTGADPE
ncbi:MAG: TetR/AcrR family transcriptional regulator [Actinomycetaceae bacterium]|nr:TetR/AcrR family transcriptional regulator [Actinomycetaceae bacterium]